jgi:hypothetical protein
MEHTEMKILIHAVLYMQARTTDMQRGEGK